MLASPSLSDVGFWGRNGNRGLGNRRKHWLTLLSGDRATHCQLGSIHTLCVLFLLGNRANTSAAHLEVCASLSALGANPMDTGVTVCVSPDRPLSI